MKRFILPLLILLFVGSLFAVESAPSEVVGYVKYDIVAGNNMVAIPMECPWTWAGEDLGASFGGDVDQVSYWDQDGQGFVTAVDLGFMWDNDFEVSSGSVLMLSSFVSSSFYSIGNLPAGNASYVCVAGNNTVMVPLNRSDIFNASDVGMEMADGFVDQVSYWDPVEQGFVTAVDLGFMWDNDYEVTIAMPLMVAGTDPFTWPNRSVRNQNNRSSK